MRELQLSGDAGERVAVDEFHRNDDRRRDVARGGDSVDGPDRNRGDDRGLARQAADYRDLRMRAVGRRARFCEAQRAMQGQVAPAHVVEDRLHIGSRRLEPGRIWRVTVELRIDQFVAGVEDKDLIVIEIGFQPTPDALLHPVGVVFDADVLNRPLGGRNAFDFTQNTLAIGA